MPVDMRRYESVEQKSSKSSLPWGKSFKKILGSARRFARRIDVERWIAYRTYDKYHSIRVDGVGFRCADKDEQMLGAMFGLLVDFVEVECACMNCISREESQWTKFVRRVAPWSEFRSREEGLAHLDWGSKLVLDEDCGVYPGEPGYGELSPQARSATEMKALYLWWVDERPKRPDPLDASGYSEVYGRKPMEWVDVGLGLRELVRDEETSAAALRAHALEESYDEEDQAMLHRLIDIRRSMWT